jgi:hypothetical protein
MADVLFVTAGLIDDDDIPMDSPHLQNGFPRSGLDGPGAIGQPTSMYNHTRKADDLGLHTLLSQARNDRASDYGMNEPIASRWDEYARSNSAAPGFLDNKYSSQNGPMTASLFPGSAASPHLSLQGLHIGQASQHGDAATQALNHLSSLQGLIAPMARAVEEVEKLKKEVEMWKNDWHKVGEEKRGIERAVNDFRVELEREKAGAEAKQVSRVSISKVVLWFDRRLHRHSRWS